MAKKFIPGGASSWSNTGVPVPVQIDVLGGPPGPIGPPNAGVFIKGIANVWPPVADSLREVGDLYVVPDPPPPGAPAWAVPGHGAFWDGKDWVDAGLLRGTQGERGEPGPPLNVRGTATGWVPDPTPSPGDIWQLPEILPAGTPAEFKPGGAAAWDAVTSKWIPLETIRGPAGHSVEIFGPSALPPTTGVEKGDMWLSTDPSLFAATFDPSTIVQVPGPQGPQGLPGPSAYEAWKLSVGRPTAAMQEFIDAIKGQKGDKGDEGPAGQTFTIEGVSPDVASLPAAPPRLTVYLVQATGELWIYDTQSTAADPVTGWVNLGKIAGPTGQAAYLSTPVADVSQLPTTGTAGEMVFVTGTGHLWGWDDINNAWVDGGRIGATGIDDGINQGDMLVWDAGNSRWATRGHVPVVAGADTGDILRWNQVTGLWEAGPGTLANHNDVAKDTPADKDSLVWDDTLKTWKPDTIKAGIQEWEPEAWEKGDIVAFDGKLWKATAAIPQGSGVPSTPFTTGMMSIAGGGATAGSTINVELRGGTGNVVTWDYTAVVGDTDPLQMAINLAAALNAEPTTAAVATFTAYKDRVLVAGKAEAIRAIPHPPISAATMTASSDWRLVTPNTLSELVDVQSAMVPRAGQVLTFDGTEWGAADPSGASPIVFLGTGAWDNTAALDGTDPMYGMPAGTTPAPTDYPPIPGDSYIDLATGLVTTFTGPVTTRRAGGAITGGGGSLDIVRERLQDLDDVANTTPSNNNILMYDGGQNQWTPVQNSFATLSYVDNRVEALAIGLAHDVAVASITNTPPDGPSNANIYYLVGKSPTGVWAGHANEIAHYTMGTGGSYDWHFETPRDNETHLVEDQAATYTWNGTEWVKVAAAQTGANINAASLYQVGDIKQSILTETQFRTMLGTAEADKWALADGRNVAGSDYTTLTGNTNVPDLRGGFLRMAGQSARDASWNGGSLGSYQEDNTARPKSGFTGTTNTTGAHTHTSSKLKSAAGSGNPASANIVAGDGYNANWGTITNSAGAHSHSVSINGGGDTETRPKNYGVNFFIKVRA